MFVFSNIYLDNNELFIIITFILGLITTHFLPQKYSREMTFILFLWGIAVPFCFDFNIGGGMFDFYRDNDTNNYDIVDFFNFTLFGYFNYFFIYVYDSLKVTKRTHIFYNLICSLFAVGFEKLMVLNGIFTYQNGYTIFYSFAIYLYMNSITLLLYEWIKSKCNIYYTYT